MGTAWTLAIAASFLATTVEGSLTFAPPTTTIGIYSLTRMSGMDGLCRLGHFGPTLGSSSSAPRQPANVLRTKGIVDEDEVPTTFEQVEVRDPTSASTETCFYVLPPDLWAHGEPPIANEVKDVVIKPGFGWGEGTHPTTYMCLQFLWEHVGCHTGRDLSMMDYGTGSGVLAIAAKRLGACRVVGIDKDDEILECANENAELNFGEEHGIELIHGREVVTGTRGVYLSDGMSSTFDVVVANMLAPALCRLAPAITSAVKEEGSRGAEAGGILALSGMRRDQVGDVKSAYATQGVTFFEERSQEGAAPGAAWAEWVLLKGRRGKMTDEQARIRSQMLSDLAVEG